MAIGDWRLAIGDVDGRTEIGACDRRLLRFIVAIGDVVVGRAGVLRNQRLIVVALANQNGFTGDSGRGGPAQVAKGRVGTRTAGTAANIVIVAA
ncbi:MAG: hypothetical protein DIZ77_17250 [endosymbiont of Seepiophila jonesi]|uniref:Uncharacterized protein n=1 Tax=endosymbiont of Lamellibrachia luymesi TaxID=2200907 RepID=A0A370DYI2_9GAMM|nr:MAG: hypothetical protein DIZ77_17250 [endosymbiont of Seepiophila jonesi]RDH91453.1 MAG: hypothetical protein DIZ79_06075 [endosymbiont of Lamellibrachia luymesi]